MLIRVKGYNTGAKEYLEEGTKAGREFSRDELDQRVILDGDLDITQMIYESIPDQGQDRYLSFTMAFREDEVSVDTLHAVTQEFKQFMMTAYRDDEFNFYAEAHLPKMKTIKDKKTGEMIDRKPHIHILIPKKNMLSGNIFDPCGSNYKQSEKHLEAFQEHINKKYNLASPRDHVRADITDAASVLSRYKGDDFYGKNREFKQGLVKQVIDRDIRTRKDFYALVREYGETRIRNEGKPNEYASVKLDGDAKGTNLKETIFQDHFIVHRELKKAPLDQNVIQQRLAEWPQRAREIKYISKAGPDFRQVYVSASTEERAALLTSTENQFYQTYGDRYVVHPKQRKRDRQRSSDEVGRKRSGRSAAGLQDVSGRSVADRGQGESAEQSSSALLLPNDARVHMGREDPGRDPGLRTPVRRGRGRGREPTSAGVGRGTAATRQGAASSGAGQIGRRDGHSRQRVRDAVGSGPTRRLDLPPHAQNPRRIPSVSDIASRTDRLFGRTNAQGAGTHEVSSSPAARRPRRSNGAGPTAGRVQANGRDLSHLPTTADIEARTDRLFGGDRSAAGGRGRSGRRSSRTNTVPPYARNPHRTPSVSDIEARTDRLFGRSGKAAGAGGAAPAAGKRRRGGQRTRGNTLPPHARNPHRIPSVTDISSRTDRLFGSSSIAPGSGTALKRISIKSLTAGRSASTVAAYLKRQAAVDNLKPSQRQQIKRINNQYFATRRALFADTRLTRQDKAQLSAVLTFERMKANIEVMKSTNGKGINLMASANIRDLIDEDVDDTGFTITGARGPEPTPVRDRVKRIVDRVSDYIDPKPAAADERLLAAKDLYTKKARFSQNIHYLDKKTDKTLFVDTGKTIAMRRTGITEAGVAVALQLAKERFGSTLTINGTAEFKTLVIEAAAKNGLDIHFTDRSMNESLAARRTELEIGSSDAVIAAGQKTAHPGAAAWSDAGIEKLKPVLAERLDISTLDGKPLSSVVAPPGGWTKEAVIEQLSASLGAKVFADGFDASIGGVWVASTDPHRESVRAAESALKGAAAAAAPSELVRREDAWRKDVGVFESDIRDSDLHLAHRGRDHANWMFETGDKSAQGLGLIREYMGNPAYRDAFKDTVVELYKRFQGSADVTQRLDERLTPALRVAMDAKLPDQAGPQSAPAASDELMGSVFNADREAKWRASMGLSETDVLDSAQHMANRGSDHAMWLIADPKAPADGIDLVRGYLQNQDYREAFKSAVEDLYKAFADSPDLIEELDKNTALHSDLVNEVEDALHTDGGQQAAPVRGPLGASTDRKGPVEAKVGTLVSHGPAPYQNDDRNNDSYFVTLNTPTGLKTSWGVGLEDAMLNDGKEFTPGDTIQLRDLGTLPVTIMVANDAGVEEPMQVERRSWSAEVITTSANKTTVQQDDSGPVMD